MISTRRYSLVHITGTELNPQNYSKHVYFIAQNGVTVPPKYVFRTGRPSSLQSAFYTLANQHEVGRCQMTLDLAHGVTGSTSSVQSVRYKRDLDLIARRFLCWSAWIVRYRRQDDVEESRLPAAGSRPRVKLRLSVGHFWHGTITSLFPENV